MKAGGHFNQYSSWYYLITFNKMFYVEYTYIYILYIWYTYKWPICLNISRWFKSTVAESDLLPSGVCKLTLQPSQPSLCNTHVLFMQPNPVITLDDQHLLTNLVCKCWTVKSLCRYIYQKGVFNTHMDETVFQTFLLLRILFLDFVDLLFVNKNKLWDAFLEGCHIDIHSILNLSLSHDLHGAHWLSFSRYSKLGASNLCSWLGFFANSFSISMISPW